MTDTVRIGVADAIALCELAAIAVGASEETARSLAKSVVAAEAEGLAPVGLSHFIDYLDALEAGRIDGKAEPVVTKPALALTLSDAKGGAAHTAFDRVSDDLAKTARLFGVAIFSQKNAYTCGALGYFTGRLAAEGLVAFAATNGPAVLAGSGSTRPVYCTNPMSFAAPVAGGPPLVIDQSSSATAFVSIRKAAEEGRDIPEGWALDAAGNPTTDPAAAMKGALLAFGGEPRRQHRADGRGARGRAFGRQLVARRAMVHRGTGQSGNRALRARHRSEAPRPRLRGPHEGAA